MRIIELHRWAYIISSIIRKNRIFVARGRENTFIAFFFLLLLIAPVTGHWVLNILD